MVPFLKWVGGKRQLIHAIEKHLPDDINNYTYIEPFIGGGALFFHLQPQNAVISDFNEELINVYRVIRNSPMELLSDLEIHKNEAEYFYQIRSLDRSSNFKDLPDVKRASRFIFLNKTCFNGLYRVNAAGEFNVPFGRYKSPNIVNKQTIRAVSKFLNSNNISIYSKDYRQVLKSADINSFVYLDPPYHPLSVSSNFTGYVQGGWNAGDQENLKKSCDDLDKRGIKFLLSNSATPFIKDLYKDYLITIVKATRAINSKGTERGAIDEVLVRNYE